MRALFRSLWYLPYLSYSPIKLLTVYTFHIRSDITKNINNDETYKSFILIGGQGRAERERGERRQSRTFYKNIIYIFIELIFFEKYIKKR